MCTVLLIERRKPSIEMGREILMEIDRKVNKMEVIETDMKNNNEYFEKNVIDKQEERNDMKKYEDTLNTFIDLHATLPLTHTNLSVEDSLFDLLRSKMYERDPDKITAKRKLIVDNIETLLEPINKKRKMDGNSEETTIPTPSVNATMNTITIQMSFEN